jgi:hypothetical protein
MVCATPKMRTTATATRSKIAGGFVLASLAALMTAWRACRLRPLGIGDFRTWLACHELEARRCLLHDDRAPSYGYAELAKVLDVSERRARASVNRLVAAGLIQWSDSAIGFLVPRVEPAEGLEDTIGGGKGSVTIPRRILRFLANGSRPALIATVLGLLLRCLSRRKSGFDGRGRVKASWIARVFAVDLRRVKTARRELVALGWIESESSSQRAENRWGRAYRIDLAWARVEPGGRSLPPPPARDSPAIATPSVDQEPLRERIQNQEPAGGPTGFSISGQGKEDKPLAAPTLADIRLDDLRDTSRLLELHGQSLAKGLVGESEADRLRFVGAAEHALTVAKQNPPGLFAWLVRGGCWRYITQDDEDRAMRRLKLHDHGPPRSSSQPARFPSASSSPPASFSSSRPIEPGGLSDDARMVREIRGAMIRAGLFRDPWPAFSVRNPGWDRGRWDAALVELGLS